MGRWIVILLIVSALYLNAIELKRDGWNLVSVCQDINSSKVDMSEIIEIQNQEGLSLYSGEYSVHSNLQKLEAGYGYWIKGQAGIFFDEKESLGSLSKPLIRDGWTLMANCEERDAQKIDMTRFEELQSQDGHSLYQGVFSNYSNLLRLNKGDAYWVKGNKGESFDVTLSGNAFSGKVIDGEIAGATVFLDLNRDGNLSGGEPSTISLEDGSYELNLTVAQKQHVNYLNKQAPIIAFGGTDIRNNQPFDDQLKSSYLQSGTVNITPFSTLISEIAEERLEVNSTISMTTLVVKAKEDIEELYGIKQEIIDKDPIALAKEGNLTLLNQTLQLHRTAQIMKMALILHQNEDRESARAVLKSYRALAKAFTTLRDYTPENNRTIVSQILDEVMAKQSNLFDVNISQTIQRSVEKMTGEVNRIFHEHNGSALSDTALNGIVAKIEKEAPLAMILFSEDFNYAEGTALDVQYSDIWSGRYDDIVDATIQNGRAVLGGWASLGVKERFYNLRYQWSRVSINLFDESSISYLMRGIYGISVTFDGVDKIKVASGNQGFAPHCAYETIEVIPDINNSVKVEIYVKDDEAIVHIIDKQGRQTTKLLPFTYGDIDYGLGLGYHGAYDNLEIAYLKDEPPLHESANRTPLFVTSTTLDEGVINTLYESKPTDRDMIGITFVPVQVYADQGEGVVTYKVVKGILPVGITLSNEYNDTGNEGSPKRYLAHLHGTPTVVGNYYFTIEAMDELGQKDSRDFYIRIKDGNPTPIFIYDDFNATDGENATTVENSIWEDKDNLSIVDGKADTSEALLHLTELLRNDPRQYLHIRAKFYPQTVSSTAGISLWYAEGGLFGVDSKYENGKVEVRSNNIGYEPQTYSDDFNVSLEDNEPLMMDIYLKGQESRVYVTDTNGTQATILYDNYRLLDEESDYKLYVYGEESLVDEVLIETVDKIPEFYNELKITSNDVREGFEGLSYSDKLFVMSGKAPYVWTSTTLPNGLNLSTEGEITGVASSSGVMPVTFTVTDSLGSSDSMEINLTIKTDDTTSGELLFADDFDISPSEVTVSVRDGEHYSAHPEYALRYENNKLLIQAHKQGGLKKKFLNDGIEPLTFSWSMNKGMVTIAREGTCWGVLVEYDSVQRVKVNWGDICYEPFMEQRDFILKSSQEEIDVAVEIKGQEITVEVKDSKEVYQRGKFTISTRDITNYSMGMHFRDNTPYGVGLYTSYQSGNMYVDNLRIVQGADSLLASGSKLKQQEVLGKLLFYDPILSDKNNRSCASCHLPQKGFTDGKQGSMGLGGSMIARNTPSLTSAALMGSFFHDGRASSITEQSLDTIQNPAEMNQDLDELVIELSNIDDYVNRFNTIWSDGITTTYIGNALEAYINTLLEMRTKFDQDLYRQGDFMDENETAGFILFDGKAQCTLCHILEPINNVGDFVYNEPKFEVTGTPSAMNQNELTADIGRMGVTGEAKDRGSFRVPPLRDLLRTAPYMHNGVFKTLEEVVEFYNDGGGKGLGLDVPNQSEFMFPLHLTSTEVNQLVAFLKAMSPEYPANFSVPKSVPSGLAVGGRFGDNEDNDEDGVNNKNDNCPMHVNPNQADSNNNGFGDVCDEAM